jgi:hypothetical protein
VVGIEHDPATPRIKIEHAAQQVWQQVTDVSLFHVVEIGDRDMQT